MRITWRVMNILSSFAIFLASIALLSGCGISSTLPDQQGGVFRPTPGRPPVQGNPIDEAFATSLSGNVAYNTPPAMQLDETSSVQVLVSSNLSAAELEKQITAIGVLTSAPLSVTERMHADLKSGDPTAFDITPLQETEQLVSTKQPTEWKWLIHAKKDGRQVLSLTFARVIEIEGREYTLVKSYENTIEVYVTLSKRLEQFDWKWLCGILLTLMLIPGIWRWVDNRQKKRRLKPKQKH